MNRQRLLPCWKASRAAAVAATAVLHAISLSTTVSAFSSSAPKPTAITVEELVQRPHVQRALQEPETQDQEPATTTSPQSILSFFFNVDYDNPESVCQQLEQGGALLELPPLWFGSGGERYDQVCARHFAHSIRAAGSGELCDNDEVWSNTVDGVTAQVILCDQLARNAFRGTNEAFAYDTAALGFAGRLTRHILDLENDDDNPKLQGTVYSPYLSTTALALMHSEDAQDHERALQLYAHARDTTSPVLTKWWDQQETFELQHKNVIDRFGRYPHRNRLLGRTNTREEDAWLADTENLPGWAKSQG